MLLLVGLLLFALNVDRDDDGIDDSFDNCPATPNTDQFNIDADAYGDACDDDADGDGVPNALDNCPGAPNVDQAAVPVAADDCGIDAGYERAL